MPGLYRIIVEVHWDHGDLECEVSGEGGVMVTSAVDQDHAEAALKVLSTPDALLTLVFGGDHLEEGVAAIQSAIKNPVLAPHFAYVEMKRVAQRFGKRKSNLKAAAKLIDDTTIMSPAEIKRAAGLAKTKGADKAAMKSIATTLKRKVKTTKVGNDIKKMVDALN